MFLIFEKIIITQGLVCILVRKWW